MNKKIKPKIVDTVNKLYNSFEGIDSLIIEVNRTTDTSHGDLYTNVAMKLAKILKRNPMLIAEEITKNIEAMDSVEKIEIATPGYINFFLTKFNKFNVQSTETSTKFQKLHKNTSIMERVMTILIFKEACFMRKIAYHIGHQISYK